MTGLSFAPDLASLTLEDIPAAVALSRSFDWPHRSEDWALMLRMGQGVKHEKDGQLLGTAMWWSLGVGITTLGMVIVSKTSQGQGIGRQLIDRVLSTQDGTTVRLIGTEAGLSLYQKKGFQKAGLICQYQGIAQAVDAPASRVHFAGSYVLPQLQAFDRDMTGLSRDEVLRVLVTASDVAVVTGADGSVVGYALCRRFGHGRVIGPVVSVDDATAKALLSAFIDRYQGHFMRCDTPSDSALAPWLVKRGLLKVDEGVSMQRGDFAPSNVFALASQALG
ncbi:MAG: GNAT family N-acetyltransferase [Pseudomonadota bacterium]